MIIPISLVVFLLIAWVETALQEFLLRKPVKAQKAQKSENFLGRDPKGLPTCRHDDWYTCICKLTKEQIKQVEDEYKKQIWKKI